jgi:hypothetical protein
MVRFRCLACGREWKESELFGSPGHWTCGDAFCRGTVCPTFETDEEKWNPQEVRVPDSGEKEKN